MSVLSVRGLQITYRTSESEVSAVRGVDLDIERGEVLGLAGESGCGKSSIASAILKLLPEKTKVEGEILLDGKDVLAMKPGQLRAARWNEASIIFQGAMHALNPVIKLGDQVVEAILTHNPGDAKKAQAKAVELFEKVGLTQRRIGEYPHQLSGGQKQRVMIAMALACDPALVIADEPTTALDVMVQAQVLTLLADLQSELGLSLLFITHDLSVLVDVADRIAVMYAGRVVEEGPAEQIFAGPIHPYTKALAGAFPEIGDPRYRGNPTGLAGDPPDPQEIPSGCAFHPRCAEVFEPCSSSVPILMKSGEHRAAACHLVDGSGGPSSDREVVTP